MARKGWDELSPAYRQRLERGGITPAQYAAGASLSKARGHAKTPEHAERNIDRLKYPEYFSRRQDLIRLLQQKKEALFGGSSRWDSERSMQNIRSKPISNTQLQWAVEKADYGDLIDAIRDSPETYKFLLYH